MRLKDALVLVLLMNFKGIREVDYTAQLRDNDILDNQQYTILMGTVIVLGAITAVLVKYLYRPEDCFLTYKKHTIHHSDPSDELRILSCIHSQADVTLTLSLLDACFPTPSSPLCVYLMHLVELAGRSDAVLKPYKQRCGRPRKINSTASNSDRIVNAFNTFERQRSPGAVSLLSYVCISPYNTMHEDICTVALDKKAVLVLIPFHKRYNMDGTIEPPNLSMLTLNQNVLCYAPCSVAILIDQAGAAVVGVNHQIAMYFIGGPDDREALALAARMAENPQVSLTVMRFRESHERRLRSSQLLKENNDERIDNEILDDFIRENVDDQRIIYREEEINTGEEMVGVIRETNGMFSLLIVGRRGEAKDYAKDSLMGGLSEWSEHPELGVVGDLLVSPDFGCMVPTIVVKQQTMMGNYDPQFTSKVAPLDDADDQHF
ncbi:hypothetical protein LUZ60_001019 [Juncus effusus]|nr:hypothetical protein LUZ60_001019 [Juncus effusus]